MAQHTAGTGDLVFGVVSGDPAARAALAVISDELSKAIGVDVRARVIASYAELSSQLADGELQLAWAPPVLVGELSRSLTADVLACSRRRSGASYHAVLFARRGGPVTSLAAVRGCRAVWVDPASVSGYLLARRYLNERLGPLDEVLGSQRFLRTHSEVAREVLSGAADLGATYANLDPDTGALLNAGWVEIGASSDAPLVLATLGPAPGDAIVAARSLGARARQAAAEVLLSPGAGVLAAARVLFHAHGFVRPEPGYVTACLALASESSLRTRSTQFPAVKL